MPGIIAIVGRPNVGKSALFNRIAGRRIAIVHDEPGVTRDRVSVPAEWRGQAFTLVDTGGIGLMRGEKARDIIGEAAIEQVLLAIESADVIILVVNAQEGVLPLDQEVAVRLRRSNKKVLVAANKADHSGFEAGLGEFSQLGFEQIFPVSAIHDRGIENLMNEALKSLPPAEEIATPAAEPKEEGAAVPGPLKLAIVGRPNAGKSSLINFLTHSERVIVSPIPGTTRDAVDVPFEVETEGLRQRYILIDTAGVRKTRRVDTSVEFFSVKRTEDSIARCDIAVLVIDAEAGVGEQDKKIAGKIVEEKKACIVVINKWDLYQEKLARIWDEGKDRERKPGAGSRNSLAEFGSWVQKSLFFLDYAPVIFTSATSGYHLDRLLEAVRFVTDQLQQQIPTALLNRTLHEAIEKKQPISASGNYLKFFYATQVRQAPPTFLLFVNRQELFSTAYQKYLAGEMRRSFGYEGCPILLIPKARPKTIEPVRSEKQRAGKTKRTRGTTRRKS